MIAVLSECLMYRITLSNLSPLIVVEGTHSAADRLFPPLQTFKRFSTTQLHFLFVPIMFTMQLSTLNLDLLLIGQRNGHC